MCAHTQVTHGDGAGGKINCLVHVNHIYIIVPTGFSKSIYNKWSHFSIACTLTLSHVHTLKKLYAVALVSIVFITCILVLAGYCQKNANCRSSCTFLKHIFFAVCESSHSLSFVVLLISWISFYLYFCVFFASSSKNGTWGRDDKMMVWWWVCFVVSQLDQDGWECVYLFIENRLWLFSKSARYFVDLKKCLYKIYMTRLK